jgi:single-strand DNA-binding protein
MNNITVAGQLGRDSEIKYLSSGDAVCNFSVADSQGKDKPTIWWNCQLFGKRAESLSKYLMKGQSVTVSGTLSEREWTDKDGNKRKQIDLRVNDVALQGGQRQSSDAPQSPSPRQQQSQRSQLPDDGFQDDIPF